MSKNKIIDKTIKEKYKFGFVTNIDQETIPPGLSEEVIHVISSKKNEPKWLLDWRLKAYRKWIKMKEPNWAKVHYSKIDYDLISYYSAPKKKKKLKSLDEVDPEILRTYEKLGIPIEEQKMLAGVAVDAVFDSVSIGTTFKEELAKAGVIFCPFSEAVTKYPKLIKKYLGSVVPYTDNFFATNVNPAVQDERLIMAKSTNLPIHSANIFRVWISEILSLFSSDFNWV